MKRFSSYNELLEEIRESIKDKRGITQATIAIELGVSREHLNKMLNNKAQMPGVYLYYLMYRLGI